MDITRSCGPLRLFQQTAESECLFCGTDERKPMDSKSEYVLPSEADLSYRFQSITKVMPSVGFTSVVFLGREKVSSHVSPEYTRGYASQDIALKAVLKSKFATKHELEQARYEIEIHSRLEHPNILPLLSSEETPEALVLIMPMAVSDLHSITVNKTFPENVVARLSLDLLRGLEYLHYEAGVVHRDINPRNILILPGGSVRICDFGFAEPLAVGDWRDASCSGPRGSIGFISPEQTKRLPYDHRIDVFALGVIVYSLLGGYEPFFPSNRVALLDGHSDETVLQFESPYWDGISEGCVEFIRRCLCGDPARRITSREAVGVPWVQESKDLQFSL
jgi:serine/threonine protein kinase